MLRNRSYCFHSRARKGLRIWPSQIKILSWLFNFYRVVFLFLFKKRKQKYERGGGDEEWRRIDSSGTNSHFHFHHTLKQRLILNTIKFVHFWLRFTPKKVGWQINEKTYWMTLLWFFSLWLQLQMVFDYSWRETYSSAKIRFVAPNCVYTSNWAHEVMAMQDVYLCIVEVQQWCVCKVIDTSCSVCNYTIITNSENL